MRVINKHYINMKIMDYLRFAFLSAMCVVVLAGCSPLKKTGVSGSEGRVVTLSDGRKVVVTGQKQAGDDQASATVNKNDKKLTPPKGGKQDKKSKGNKVKEQAPMDDRESVGENEVGGGALTAPAPQPSANMAVALPEDFSLNGEWTIFSVRGNEVSGEERPYVTFDLPAKRFYGNNGCNYINGDLTVDVNRALKFDNMISTMKMCQDDQFQYLINLALADVNSYSARQVKHETFLDLKDETGRTILVLRRHNMDFLNGAWMVSDLNGTPLVQEDEATMTFDTTDLRIHGTTGCNIFNGELFIDPDKTTSLQILKLATTRMACPPDSRETEFLLALESVETAKPQGADTVILYDTDGKAVFKLKKVELRDDTQSQD